MTYIFETLVVLKEGPLSAPFVLSPRLQPCSRFRLSFKEKRFEFQLQIGTTFSKI